MIGEQLGQYRIETLLGEGGMGVVYRALDTQLGRYVAIKVIPPSAADDPTARPRLLREARTASVLNHPCICTIYDVRTVGGQLFLVMEYVAGETLHAIARPAGLPMRDCISFGIQMADALEHAHQHGVIHRDLKTVNVIVTPDRRLKVLDFGLAKRVTASGVNDSLPVTATGIIVGTVPYMAPELLRGEPPSPATDIWSLGVVLYEIATGRLPFTGRTNLDAISAILDRPPASLPSAINESLAATIWRCLSKDPASRWARVADVRTALETLPVDGRQVSREATTRAEPRGYMRPSSLAVLPLENLSGDPSQEFLADGLTESLITTLAKVSALRVISRTSVMRYKGTRTPLSQIANELRVDAVIQGSVIRSGGAIRISAQLLDAHTDTHLWAETYDRQFSDVLAIHSEIAHAIVLEIQVKLTHDERTDLLNAPSVDTEAYEEYLKGRFHWNRRTGDDLRHAIRHFEQAIASGADSVPLAYVGLADSYLILASYGLLAPRDAMPRMKAMLGKALALDSSLGEAHCSMGTAVFYYDWNTTLAEQSFQRGIQLSPRYPIAHQWYALFLTACGRFEEALRALATAHDLDPLSLAVTAQMAWVFYFARRYEQAIRTCRRALDLEPDYYQALVFSGMAHERKGMYTESISILQKVVALAGGDLTGSITLAHAYAGSGQADRARGILDQVIERSSERYFSSYHVAAVYVALGEFDTAFHWLERGYAERAWYMPSLAVDPRFDPVRKDRRFAQLVERIGTARI